MKANKRGFTLVELCIVIALVAIIASMTVSFFLIMNRKTAESQIKYEILSDYDDIERCINDWIRKYDSEKYTITTKAIDPEGKNRYSLYAHLCEDESKNAVAELVFTTSDGKGVLTVKENGTEMQKYGLDRITDMQFSDTKSSSTGYKLITCDVTNREAKEDSFRTTTFMFSTNCAPYNKILSVSTQISLLASIESGNQSNAIKSDESKISSKVSKNEEYSLDDVSLYYEKNGRNVPIQWDKTTRKIVFDYIENHADIVSKYTPIDITPAGSRSKIYAYKGKGKLSNGTEVDTLYILTSDYSDIVCTNMTRTFLGYRALEEIENHNFHTEYATAWIRTFQGTNIKNLDFLKEEPWAIRDATNFDRTFADCKGLTDVSMCFTSAETGCSMESTFQNCTSLKNADFSQCEIIIGDKNGNGGVTGSGLQKLFCGCTSLERIAFPDTIDTYHNSTYWCTFKDCGNLTTIVNLDKFTNENVNSTSYMFDNCKKMKVIDLSGFSRISGYRLYHLNSDYCFHNCESLETIYVKDDMSFKLSDFIVGISSHENNYVFLGCTNLNKNSATAKKYDASFYNIGRKDDYIYGYTGHVPVLGYGYYTVKP